MTLNWNKTRSSKLHTVTEEGKFITGTDFLEGRFVKEKNDKGEETVAIDIIKDLAGRGLLFKKKNTNTTYSAPLAM